MSKINQFTFSDDPEYILEQGLSLFTVEKKQINCREDAIFMISIVNKKFINLIDERYDIQFFCEVQDDNELYDSMLCRFETKISEEIKPIFAVVKYDDIIEGRDYIINNSFESV